MFSRDIQIYCLPSKLSTSNTCVYFTIFLQKIKFLLIEKWKKSLKKDCILMSRKWDKQTFTFRCFFATIGSKEFRKAFESANNSKVWISCFAFVLYAFDMRLYSNIFRYKFERNNTRQADIKNYLFSNWKVAERNNISTISFSFVLHLIFLQIIPMSRSLKRLKMPAAARSCAQWVASQSNGTKEVDLSWKNAKPYSEMPGPKPLPLVGNTWRFIPFIGT